LTKSFGWGILLVVEVMETQKSIAPRWAMGVIGVALLVIVGVLVLGGRRLKEGRGVNGTMPRESQVNFPKGFPEIEVYPGAMLKNSTAKNPGEGDELHYTVTWTTGDTVPEVIDWYLNSLEMSGWTIDIKPDDPNNTENQYAVAFKDRKMLQLSVVRKAEISSTEITVAFPAMAEYEEEEE
jgi:hypothetical protein